VRWIQKKYQKKNRAVFIKKILFFPFRIIDYLFDRIISLVSAVIFAQVPQFIAQYIQRLGGHIDELARMARMYEKAASGSGKTVEAYIQFHLNSTVPEFVKTGEIMRLNIERYIELKSVLDRLISSNVYNKFFIFLRGIDFEVAGSTMDSFTPGVPVNIEGLIYAVTGLFIGFLLYSLLKKTLHLLLEKIH